MFEMYDVQFLFMLAITAGITSVGVFLVVSVLIPLLQKWWSYATMTEAATSWGVYLMVKLSFHKFKVKKLKGYWGTEDVTVTVIVSPFGKEKDEDDLWYLYLYSALLLPFIPVLGIYFWEVTLIFGVLVLLTKLSRRVITAKRKLEASMADPKARQDK